MRRGIVKTRPILTLLFVVLFFVSAIAWILFGLNYLLSAVRANDSPPPPPAAEVPFVEGWRQDVDKKCDGGRCSSRDVVYVSESGTNTAGMRAFQDRFVASGWRVKETENDAGERGLAAERGSVWALVAPLPEPPKDPALPAPPTGRLQVTLGFGSAEQARDYNREGIIGRHIGGFFWIFGSMAVAALLLGFVLWMSDPWDDDTIMLEDSITT